LKNRVEAHLAYIGREGELGIETDHGVRLVGKNFQKELVPDWDLDLRAHRIQDARSIRGTRRPAKLVHNLIFSMPPGTPPAKVLKAVRRLADNEFALRHRYAMALHADEAHPHVHLVVKAVSEQGERLNIRKATLRYWREQFAIHLREQGVAANATERAVRGQYTARTKDPIYRANRRAESTHERKEMLDLVNKAPTIIQRYRLGKEKLERTRSQVVAGWRAIADQLQVEGDFGLADKVRLFLARMPPPVTQQELLARKMLRESPVRQRNPLERTR